MSTSRADAAGRPGRGSHTLVRALGGQLRVQTLSDLVMGR